MGDSFFGFNTGLPSMTDDELRMAQKERAAREDADVYDFASLRHELGDDDFDDGLGDQLEEAGDDLNDETFGDDTIGKDFDFAATTAQFTSKLPDDERMRHHKPNEIAQAHSPAQQHPQGSWQNEDLDRQHREANAIWSDFAQSQHQQHRQQPGYFQGTPPSSSMMQPPRGAMSLDEMEAELHRQRQQPAFSADQGLPGKKMMSLAEVEAAMLQRNHDLHHQQQLHFQQQQQSSAMPPMPMSPFGGFANVPPNNAMQQEQLRMAALQRQHQEFMEQMNKEREMRRIDDVRKSRYDNLMTQYDKDLVQRIQLHQLASGDPYADDFYYQVYSSLRMRASGTKPAEGGRGRDSRRDNSMMARMNQQVQRIVNDAKRRPKQTQVTLEGALGKITTLSTRNPRQVLQVSDKKPHDGSPTHIHASESTSTITPKVKSLGSMNDRRRLLNTVESLYSKILELEQMRRQGPARSRRDDDEEQERKLEEWNEQYSVKVQQLWDSLHIMEDNKEQTPLLVAVLTVNKGKKLIPRIIRPLTHDQNLSILSVILAHFSQLQVCRPVIYPGTQVASTEDAQRFVSYEDMDLFMNATAPALLSFITEAPMKVVIALTRLLMEKNDIRYVAQTKPGLAFLTMLLSRAEILKQGGGALHGYAPPSVEELSLWQDVYTALFQALQGRFASIFPAVYYLVPSNPSMDMNQLLLNIDDMYIWQFLAAIAVGASMEQQHVLVTEVRDRVMENIILAKSNRLPLDRATHRIDNTNLFLHSLGLDASQVSAPL
ncbi:hypothetical protein DM01DRAFT_1340550 [Hesseltinella vesiculosa]|uniref:mRNA decay factor PAT1 domain-containing protein n=1 Tax=Hesseltinella vesiculosa TaxID=101127 RepID=A0A1X2G3L8_9FUNG|nr:hypothetical protein DM01DRAFT_1340550 [Hesseltinella vesiculosa]